MRYATSVILAAVTLTLLISTPAARGHDSLAPRGAPHHWLPKEDWVYRHWIPFDEQTLKVLLGLRGRQLEAYLFDDHRTLAQLAAQRGLTLEAVEDALLQPWRGQVDDGRMAILRDRTRRILTQGHLAQHMFFHVYHGVDARAQAPRLFHLSPRRYWHLRLRGYTGRRIARIGRVGPQHVLSGLKALFAEDSREGIIGSMRVERYRVRLGPSCYKRPPAWPPAARASESAEARVVATPSRAQPRQLLCVRPPTSS